MSQVLTVELSDDVYAAIQRQAEEAHTSPAQVAATSLAQRFGRLHRNRRVRSDAELQAARERFERHFGAIDLGYATGIDNEGIEADLAREYTNTHEAG
jgi:predicted transcriptional regulator